MEAKDTIMSHDKVRLWWVARGIQTDFDEDDIKEAQAEVSFKAGMKEVVERQTKYGNKTTAQPWAK